MTPERWQQIKKILIDALESGSAQEEAAIVDRACAHDAALRTEVETLLHQPHVLCDPLAGRSIQSELI